MEYKRFPIAPPEEAEFLEIVGISAPTFANEGVKVNVSLSFQNTGFVVGDFMWEARDQYGNLLASQSGEYMNGPLHQLPPGSHVAGEFSFIMPNHDVNITIKTYHRYSYTWLLDDTASFTIVLPTEPPELSEGEYSGENWNTGISLGGITTNGTYLWITDHYNAKVYKYDINGNYTGISWSTAGSGCINPTDITTYGNYFWITDTYKSKVYKYNLDGTYTGEQWSTPFPNTRPTGITTNGKYFWITDEVRDAVYKYDMNGIYTGEYWDTYASGCHYPFGITIYGNYLWIATHSTARVYKYKLDGIYVSSWPTNDLNANPNGITTDGHYFWITDGDDKRVYQYGGPTITEGFLDITGVTAPSEASEGDSVPIIIHTKNTGATDDFKIEFTGDLSGWTSGPIGAGEIFDSEASFTMPNHDATITVKTFHLE